MPFYTYRCDICRETFEVRHGMFFIQERCVKCNATECLTKIPSFEIKSKNPDIDQSPATPGTIVKKHIEEAKTELKKEKKRLKEQEM